jgi:GNAT superfamily N-acetyltransferase
MSLAQTRIRVATAADAPIFGQLLHAFNAEYGEPEPDAHTIAERAAPLIESREVTVLFVGEGPDGFAELRFRPSLYTGALDAYLEELYVVPERRGHGLGRALLEAAMQHARDTTACSVIATGPAPSTPRCLRDLAPRCMDLCGRHPPRSHGSSWPSFLHRSGIGTLPSGRLPGAVGLSLTPLSMALPGYAHPVTGT